MEKKTIQLFATIFIFSFILINWNDVSWVFNYRAWEGIASDFFNPYPDTALALVSANKNMPTLVRPTAMPQNGSQGQSPVPVAQANYPYSQKTNSIEIPSIAVDTPVVIATTTNKAIVTKQLDDGAVLYPGSVEPGQNGQMVVLGHSAPPNWPRIKHDYIFSDIGSLKAGDQVIFHYNNKKYTYRVTGTKIIERGGDIPPVQQSGNILTLVSCWPPGKDYQRMIVTAELIPL